MEVARDANMEEQSETAEGGENQLGEMYHDAAMLAPDADFLVDEHSSAHSQMDVADRLMYLEQRMQIQEDEVQLLKFALADVLKRLHISEAQTAALTKKEPVKAAKLVSLTLPPKAASNNAFSLKKTSSSTMPSATSSTNYSPTPVSKRSSAGGVKDSTRASGNKRNSAAPNTTTTTCKKLHESSKPKEVCAGLIGTRRVTHCKVTMQIYLSPQTKRTGPTETAVSTTVPPSVCPPTRGPAPEIAASNKCKAGSGKKPPCTLPLHRNPYQSPFSPTDTPTYKSPIKSPSQYFQICY